MRAPLERTRAWTPSLVLAAIGWIAAAPAAARQAESAPSVLSVSADDAIESYLSARGLDRLLAAQLSRRLAAAPREQRTELARRLSTLYARMIERDPSPERRREAEQKARALLADVPEADTIDLRLELARVAFARAEDALERLRLELGEPDEAAAALASLAPLGADFVAVAGRAQQRVDLLERQEAAARGEEDSDLLQQALGLARRQRSLARFHAGWTFVLAAEFFPASRAPFAADALRHFGWLLNAAPGDIARPEQAAPALFRYEHVARAAIGAAVAESLRGNTDPAMKWLDAVEQEAGAPEAVREQLFIRRVQALGLTGRWQLLMNWVSSRRPRSPAPGDEAGGGTRRLSPTEARLLIVLAMNARSAPSDEADAAWRLALRGMEDLAAAGQWGHLLDLARRHPRLLDGPTLVAALTRGLRLLDEARAARTPDGAPDARAAGAAYLAASDEFRRALAATSSNAELAPLRPRTLLLLGTAIFEPASTAAEFLDAADAFDEAARDRAAAVELAPEAMWLAVRAVEAARDKAPADASIARRHESLLAEFIALYPADPRAPTARLRRAISGGAPPEAVVRDLLEIPSGSDAYPAARREAARLLYGLYRAAPESERAWAATRFVAVAEPLLADEARRADAGDREAATRAGSLARRIAETLLALSPPDLARAQRALDLVVRLVSNGAIADATAQAEIDFRRAQIALARGDQAEAESLLASLESRSAAHADAGAAMLFQRAAKAWRALDPASPERANQAARVVELGRRILRRAEEGGFEGGLDPGLRFVRVTTAEAAGVLWTLTRDERARDLARLLYRVALRDDPMNAAILRAAAELDESMNDWAASAAKWEILLAGARAGADEWFEAKCRLVTALERADRPRAAKLMAQHTALYPGGGGPEPWRACLNAAAARLGARGAEGGTP